MLWHSTMACCAPQDDTQAHASKKSTYDFTAPSIPMTFGFDDSMIQYSSGACAPSPWPRPNWPAGSLSGAPVNVTPGHEPASRGHSRGSIPDFLYVADIA